MFECNYKTMRNLHGRCVSLLAAGRKRFFFPTSVWNCQLFNCGCKCSIQETGSISVHARWLCGLILAFEHFSDHSRSGRLSTSLILQFAGWNSRPCLGLPPPNNGNPLSTSYWPTTWLIKTALESRCQLTVKPIKPNSAPQWKQSLSPRLWIWCLAEGAETQFFLIMRKGLHIRNGKIQWSSVSTWHWDQAPVKSYTCLYGSDALCHMTF